MFLKDSRSAPCTRSVVGRRSRGRSAFVFEVRRDSMEAKKTSGNLSRRAFTPAAVAAFSFVPRRVLGGMNQAAPSDKLNIAAVGIGGMGRNYIKGCESENIAALCDVDEALAAPVFARYPNAKRYRDYRVMLENEKGIDAVIIG